jgi:hypothetical protein
MLSLGGDSITSLSYGYGEKREEKGREGELSQEN